MNIAMLPRTGWRAGLAAFLAGAAAALGQAPFDAWFLGLIGFAAGILLVANADRAGRRSWVFGLGYFGVALHWIVEPFLVDVAVHGWMAPFGLFFMAGGMALFWLLAGFIAGKISNRSARVFGFALALAAAEGIRAYIFSGFPWAHPGHILIDTTLLGAAGIAGPHGLTLLVLMTAAGGALITSIKPAIGVASYAAVVAVVSLLPRPGPDALDANAATIRLIQPNAAQHLKWQPEMIPVFFDRGLDLTRGSGADLVVWPETSLPVLLEDSERWRERIAEAAGGVPVVVGAQRFPERQARNALALLDPRGEVVATYDKHRLVPFGEYIPIRRLADWARIDGLAAIVGGGYWPGDGPEAIDMGPGLGRAFVMICYEAIFPQYLRQVERPDWQLHITNDAWFGEFSGPYQHLALARLRAAESGLPVLRAANTGISAVIDGRGTIVASLPLGQEGALDASLPSALPPTIYAQTGDLPILLLIAASLGTLLVVDRKNRR